MGMKSLKHFLKYWRGFLFAHCMWGREPIILEDTHYPVRHNWKVCATMSRNTVSKVPGLAVYCSWNAHFSFLYESWNQFKITTWNTQWQWIRRGPPLISKTHIVLSHTRLKCEVFDRMQKAMYQNYTRLMLALSIEIISTDLFKW